MTTLLVAVGGVLGVTWLSAARSAFTRREAGDVERARPFGEDAVAGVLYVERAPAGAVELGGRAADQRSAAAARQVGEHALVLAPGDVAAAEPRALTRPAAAQKLGTLAAAAPSDRAEGGPGR